MNKEEALKEARRLLKKGGIDADAMTDDEVMAKIKEVWEGWGKPMIEEMMRWINDEFMPAMSVIIAAFSKWYDSLPEEVRAELKER